MPLLAHLEELRKRIIFSILGVLVGFISCWSFADRIFGLMQQPIIVALRRHGIGGGLVYLNPTEPFNLYLEVAFVGGLFWSLSICVLSTLAIHGPWTVSHRKALRSAFLAQYGRLVPCRRTIRVQDGLSCVP
jgi:sec-independent protein translocase protein TatC